MKYLSIANMNNTTIYYLRKAELTYELRIRDCSTDGSVSDLRKRLSQCLANNTEVKCSIVNNLDPDLELEECEAKYEDLASLIADYDGNLKDTEFNRLSSRLTHLRDRTQRIPVTASLEEDMADRRDSLLEKIRYHIGLFAPQWPRNPHDDVPSAQDPNFGNPSTGLELPSLQINVEQTQPHVSKDFMACSSDDEHSVQRTRNTVNTRNMTENNRTYSERFDGRRKSIPVYKWGIKFDNSTGQSVGAFLARVEELRRARGMTTSELFESAVDLFSGPALTWYRSTLTRIFAWEDLCKEMKIVFQAPDYDFKLQQEIFNRFQGDQESIDMFIAAMEGLYSRLACNVPEEIRLKQIMHNLSPQLKDRLALFDINTLEVLRHLGRKAEAGRSRFSQRSASHAQSFLEPDLAYTEPHRRRPFHSNKVSCSQVNNHPEKSSVVCWNCGISGHRYSQCRQPRKRFCYGCGLADVIKANCPTCSSKNLRGREPASK